MGEHDLGCPRDAGARRRARGRLLAAGQRSARSRWPASSPAASRSHSARRSRACSVSTSPPPRSSPLALARRSLRRSALLVTLGRRRRGDGDDGDAAQRRARLPPGVVRAGARAARPVRGELEPAPDLRVRRRARLPRQPDPRHRLARRAAPGGVRRGILPDARARFPDQPPSVLRRASSETFIPQQTYDQVLIELGLVGGALFVLIAFLAVRLALRVGLRAPPDPRARALRARRRRAGWRAWPARSPARPCSGARRSASLFWLTLGVVAATPLLVLDPRS